MKKICFFIQNMEGGGAERVVLNLMNNLDRSEYEITLLLVENRGVYLQDLKKDVELKWFKNIFKNRHINFTVNLIKSLIEIKKMNYDIIFTQYNVALIVAPIIKYLNLKTSFIYRETNLPKFVKINGNFFKKRWTSIFYKYFILNYKTIIAQSIDMKENLLEENDKIKNRMVVINNPIDFDKIDSKLSGNSEELNYDKNRINLISVGRLSHQKGYDLLLKTLSQIKEIDFYLRILGLGPEKEKLEIMIKEYGLENKVDIIGFKENPYIYIKNSDFLISSSRYEGFPNVVLEANACGIPVIANNYKGGIGEIILPNINGEIIDITNSERLKEALIKKYKSEEVIKSVYDRYSSDKIVEKYCEVFESENA